MENNEEQIPMRFLAIDKAIQRNIVSPTEIKVRGKEVISWGDRNRYPDYLMDLYRNCTTLRSVIDGSVNYVKGDAVMFSGEADRKMNRKHETITDLVDQCAFSYLLYGGFALQVIRTQNLAGIAEVYSVDPRYIRTNEDGDVYYYSEEWSDGYVQNKKMQVYPRFVPEFTDPSQKTAILTYKFSRGQIYPSPLYAASVKACEIERNIDDFHLNALENGFTGSLLVNFNNGVPSAEAMAEVERTYNEKFSGSSNAGRIVFNWNPTKDNATTMEPLEVTDFGEKYDALAKHSERQIFAAFHANPNLFGIPTENLGFSQEEYESAFRLYNRTQIQPIQTAICDAFDKIYGSHGMVSITPFSIDQQKGEVR